MSAQLKEATKRMFIALLAATIPVLLDFLATGNFSEFGQYGAIIAFMAARLLEGVYDSIRDKEGHVIAGDVTPNTIRLDA